jgi:hypothetical protein
MKQIRQIVFGILLFFAAIGFGQSVEDSGQQIEILTVPSPAEFFAALDKIGKPDWAAFYRDPIPTTYQARALAAVNLGTLVTDGYVAVEAQDGQQVKNTGKDIITLARALGVGEHVLARGKSISDFADRNDWSALKEELDATTNEVRLAMAAQRDEGLATLITAGAWLRALQVGSRAAEMSGEPEADELLAQTALIAYLREDLDTLPETARNAPAVGNVRATLTRVEEEIKAGKSDGEEATRAARIGKVAAEFVASAAAKQK